MKAKTTFDGAKTTVIVWPHEASDLWPLGITGEGVARCRADDAYSSTIGELIAMGRAILDFGRQVVEYADSKVVTIEQVLKVLEYVETVDLEKANEDAAEDAAAEADDQAALDLLISILTQPLHECMAEGINGQ